MRSHKYGRVAMLIRKEGWGQYGERREPKEEMWPRSPHKKHTHALLQTVALCPFSHIEDNGS
jgi:hypothetical protein